MTYFDMFAAGSEHGVRYCSEATWGVTPGAPNMISLRHTGCGLILSKDTFQSEELRNDRQITDFRHGTYQVGGDTNFELSYAEYDPIIKGAFCGTFQTALTAVSGTIAIQGTLNQLYSSVVTFTRFSVGDCIKVDGSGANDGSYIISAAADATLTLLADITTETASSFTVSHNVAVSNGTADMSFTVERAHSDITQYQQFTGCLINTLSLSMAPNAIVTGVFGVIGKSITVTTTPLDASPTASQSGSPYDTFSGTLREGGDEIATITSIELNLDNAGEATFVIGSQVAQNVVLGRCNVSGTIEAYFQNILLLNKFINETESSLEVDIGGTSEYYKLFLPRVKYGGGDTSVDGEGPIMMSMPFQALYSSTYGFTIRLAKIA